MDLKSQPPSFTVSLRGYDREEVDEYLDSLAEALGQVSDAEEQNRRLHAHINRLNTRIRELEDRIRTDEPRSGSLLAERIGMLLREAEDAATDTISRAEVKAAGLVADAETKVAEADQEARVSMVKAEQEAQRIEAAARTAGTEIEAEAEARATARTRQIEQWAEQVVSHTRAEEARMLREQQQKRAEALVDLKSITDQRAAAAATLTELRRMLGRALGLVESPGLEVHEGGGMLAGDSAGDEAADGPAMVSSNGVPSNGVPSNGVASNGVASNGVANPGAEPGAGSEAAGQAGQGAGPAAEAGAAAGPGAGVASGVGLTSDSSGDGALADSSTSMELSTPQGDDTPANGSLKPMTGETPAVLADESPDEKDENASEASDQTAIVNGASGDGQHGGPGAGPAGVETAGPDTDAARAVEVDPAARGGGATGATSETRPASAGGFADFGSSIAPRTASSDPADDDDDEVPAIELHGRMAGDDDDEFEARLEAWVSEGAKHFRRS